MNSQKADIVTKIEIFDKNFYLYANTTVHKIKI